MDDLDRREAFLLAIFAAPDDDLPRLVFADYLDERGEHDWAELIRVQCELSRTEKPLGRGTPSRWHELHVRELALCCNNPMFRRIDGVHVRFPHRGFVKTDTLLSRGDILGDPTGFRLAALVSYPEWYDATELTVTGGLITGSKPIHTILTSPVTQMVTRLNLSGHFADSSDIDHSHMGADPRTGEFNLLDSFTICPTVTLQAVEALVNARECRRITHLDLRNNDLDNDAARAILRSTNLIRLQSLHLFDGNRLRGRTWAQLQERFGEDVVQ